MLLLLCWTLFFVSYLESTYHLMFYRYVEIQITKHARVLMMVTLLTLTACILISSVSR